MVNSTIQCQACQRSPMKRCLSHTTLPFGQYGPLTFKKHRKTSKWGYWPTTKGEDVHRRPHKLDEVPLSYLDWLAGGGEFIGEDEIPCKDSRSPNGKGKLRIEFNGSIPLFEGWFKQRLFAYLTRPVIQRELEALFQDPDDDSRKRLFYVSDVPPGQLLSAPEGLRTSQRREPMPKTPGFDVRFNYGTKKWVQVDDAQLDPEDRPLSATQAWDVVADAINAYESMTDINDFLDMDTPLIARAVQAVGQWFNFSAIRALRDAYRTCKLRLQVLRTQPAYDRQPEWTAPAGKRRPGKRLKSLRIRRRRLNNTMAITSIERIR